MPTYYTKFKPIKRVLLLLFPLSARARKITGLALATALLVIGIGLGISQWYAWQAKDQPQQLGVSFIPSYAQYLGQDPQQTMDAIIHIGVKRFRLVSYWNEIEANEGSYDFSQLDWQFKKAEAAGAKINLAVGLRQPRWPECHVPDWAIGKPVSAYQNELDAFITAVSQRYKASPSLQSYQLENEYYNAFGTCNDNSSARLQHEFGLLKNEDGKHPIILSKSNNSPVPILGQPQPDVLGLSIYRRVWDSQFTNRYFTYPLPSWYYGFLAGTQKLLRGQDTIIHELQMEPWPSGDKPVLDISKEEQAKSFAPEEFKDRVDFAKDTGIRTIDLWGAEWWYQQMKTGQNPGYWQAAEQVFAKQ